MKDIIKIKFSELRNELYTIELLPKRQTTFSLLLHKSKFVESLLQLMFLFDGNPYPYKKWLGSLYLTTNYSKGNEASILRWYESINVAITPLELAKSAKTAYIEFVLKLMECDIFHESKYFQYESTYYYGYLR